MASTVGMMSACPPPPPLPQSSSSDFLHLLDCSSSPPSSSHGWMSPRISFSRDDEDKAHHLPPAPHDINTIRKKKKYEDNREQDHDGEEEEEGDIVLDFEFRLNDVDPVMMLPADELFSDGKLVPLQLKPTPPPAAAEAAAASTIAGGEMTSPEKPQKLNRVETSSGTQVVGDDQYVFSPKMPVRCSSRWRELLGLKKSSNKPKQCHSMNNNSHPPSTPTISQTTSSPPPPPPTTTSSTSAATNATNQTLVRGLLKQYFLHRNSKITTPSAAAAAATSSSVDLPSLSSSNNSYSHIPLLRDSSTDSSCRLSLSSSSSSSSSSGLDHEDVPRLSLDTCYDKQHHLLQPSKPLRLSSKTRRKASDIQYPSPPLAAVRGGRNHVRRATMTVSPSASSVDSPRMNSYGKIVFQSLERSSSSPGAFYNNSTSTSTSGGLRGEAKRRHHHHHQRTMASGGGGSCLLMERSYSANKVVHVTPVLNVVPLRVSSSSSVIGFLSPHKKDSSGATRGGGGGCKGGSTTVANAAAVVATGRGRDGAVGSGSTFLPLIRN